MTAQPETIEFVKLIAAAADAKQGEDIVALDVSAPLGIVEAFVHGHWTKRTKRAIHR
jgi:ribosome-associated protein